MLFHGFASTAAQEAQRTGLAELAPESGVILVAPQGAGEPSDWHIFDGSFDDTEFTDQILTLVRDSKCVRTDAIWLAGFSAGSAWTGVYGCGHTAGIAGLLMHSGLPPAICPAADTPNIVIVHGTADPVVPFAGGSQQVGDSKVALLSVPDSAAAWASTAGCTPTPIVRRVDARTSMTTWSGCARSRTVTLQAVTDLGHAWAGGADAPDVINPGCVLVQALVGATDAVDECLAAEATAPTPTPTPTT